MEFRKPEHEGQICRIIHPMDDEDPLEVYILTEDPLPFDDDDSLYVVSLSDLQRNVHNPHICQQIPVAKNELNVIAENLEAYVESWNQ